MTDTDPRRASDDRTVDWAPVAGVEPRPDEWELPDLDILAELTHPVRSRVLRALDHPCTVAELAAQLEVPVTRLYHHVNRLEALGLIRVVATRRVGAATERRYQIVAASFGVAKELLSSSDPRELAVALGAAFDVAKMGFQRYVERGGYRESHDGPRTFLSLGEMRLTPARQTQLMGQLAALVAEFGTDDPGDEATVVTLFIAASPEAV